jgi:hypothetical protein
VRISADGIPVPGHGGLAEVSAFPPSPISMLPDAVEEAAREDIDIEGLMDVEHIVGRGCHRGHVLSWARCRG